MSDLKFQMGGAAIESIFNCMSYYSETTELKNINKLMDEMKKQARRKFDPTQPDSLWTVFVENLITAAIESGADCGVVLKAA